MAALDTNALVRYVVQDDRAQFAAARALVSKCIAAREALFVPVTVTLELEWVLRASYGFSKDEVITALSNLFSAAEMAFESERALEVALQLYREGSATSRTACTWPWLHRREWRLCGRSTSAQPAFRVHAPLAQASYPAADSASAAAPTTR
jgi:predicted nucleic-acid-binding protein